MSALPATDHLSDRPFGGQRHVLSLPATFERVGPNAIIQTIAALDELCGVSTRNRVLEAAHLGALAIDPPTDMVRVATVNALNRAILVNLPNTLSALVMTRAGQLTGQYILENRIPAILRRILPNLPRFMAIAALMRAIRAHSWTFAGAARVETRGNRIEIFDNPICLGTVGYAGCLWHAGVFEALFQALVSPNIAVREMACGGLGDEACAFEIV